MWERNCWMHNCKEHWTGNSEGRLGAECGKKWMLGILGIPGKYILKGGDTHFCGLRNLSFSLWISKSLCVSERGRGREKSLWNSVSLSHNEDLESKGKDLTEIYSTCRKGISLTPAPFSILCLPKAGGGDNTNKKSSKTEKQNKQQQQQ